MATHPHPIMNLKSYQDLRDELRWTLVNKSYRPIEGGSDPLLLRMQALKQDLIQKYKQLPQTALVSIVMPTFNRAKLIGTAIRSVQLQSYRNWELIISDDGSTDNTEKVIKLFNESRIKYVKKPQNQGAGKARNVALGRASGKYVAYLDSDNEWDPHYLLLMVNALEAAPAYKSIYCAQDIYRYDSGKRTMNAEGVRVGLFNRSMLENRNFIDLNVFMHRYELFDKNGGFDTTLEKLLDWDLILRYSESSSPFMLPCRLGKYYFGRTANQITYNKTRRPQQILHEKLMKNKLSLASAPELQAKYQTHFFFSNLHPGRVPPLSRKTVVILIQSAKNAAFLKLCKEAVIKYSDQRFVSIIEIRHKPRAAIRAHINQAIRAADPGCDVVLLYDVAIVTDAWLNFLQQAYSDFPKAGIVAPRRVLPRGSSFIKLHTPYCSPSFEADASLSQHYKNIADPYIMPQKGYVELSVIPLVNVLITRDYLNVFRQSKEAGFHSDQLFCRQVVRDGYKILYTPHSKVYYLQ